LTFALRTVAGPLTLRNVLLNLRSAAGRRGRADGCYNSAVSWRTVAIALLSAIGAGCAPAPVADHDSGGVGVDSSVSDAQVSDRPDRDASAGTDAAGDDRATSADAALSDRAADAAIDGSSAIDAAGADAGRPRHGSVQLDGHALRDDDGAFHALGTTLMWAAWGYKFDRSRLERTLQLIADSGFDYIRALGVVGDPINPDFWDGREIDWHWSDYDAVITGVTDLAYDSYGLRVQWTLIGDGQVNIPLEADRYALVDRFVAMSVGRVHKIILFEIANEAWANGFAGDTGNDQLRALTQYLRDRTSVLVAASAPSDRSCVGYAYVYSGDIADIATIHFPRDTNPPEGGWLAVRQPWSLLACSGLPVASNNEPIGPGSTVTTEDDPARLVAAAIVSYVAGLPFHVLHTRAGVRGDVEWSAMAGVGSFGQLDALVPADLPNWQRSEVRDLDAPLKVYASDASGSYPSTLWPELVSPQSGVTEGYAAISGNRFFVLLLGVLDHVVIEARRNLDLQVHDPMTGTLLAEQALDTGQQSTLSGASWFIVSGAFR